MLWWFLAQVRILSVKGGPMSEQFNRLGLGTTGHSATVEMTLYIGDASFSVLQSSRDAIKINAAENVPAGDAILETTVDGRLHRRLVRVLGSSSRVNWVDIAGR
jgi:hypothetical protein